jgi:hypothetical protein
LTEPQVWIHPRRRIEEPDAKEPRGVLRVFFPAGEVIGERERGHRPVEPPEIFAIGDPLDLGVPLTVSADVRSAIWPGRVRPPVRRLAHVVVLVAARRRHLLVHHGHRRDLERAVRFCFEFSQRALELWFSPAQAVTHAFHMRAVDRQELQRLERHRRAGCWTGWISG